METVTNPALEPAGTEKESVLLSTGVKGTDQLPSRTSDTFSRCSPRSWTTVPAGPDSGSTLLMTGFE